MPVRTPAVNRAIINLANAHKDAPGDADAIAARRADLAEAKAVAALDGANLTPEQRDRVATALLTDTVRAWTQRQLASAPRALDAATRAKVVRLLTDGGEDR